MSFIKLILHKLPKVMKQRVFSQWWIGLTQTVTLASLAALTTIATTDQLSHAKGQTFYCGKSKGIPVTFVGTQDGRIDFDQINSSSVTVKGINSGGILSQGFSEPPKTTQQKADDLLVQAADKYEIGDLRNYINNKVKMKITKMLGIELGNYNNSIFVRIRISRI
ncbi:hypothetical protein [Dolichospermum flos-aquae]|uniref:Uncharacterized protein n=1 Tax=Dolichospermum flos-aquae LEGE 04289 TaxID=1828708 RepID=A0ACC5Q0P9_DOLFA|nr:hypothetical protein [Dolichospermum flos-aquae]MBE9219048.1 hypothetical protein [Dolichospermum flos-aquae LEGE 04289]